MPEIKNMTEQKDTAERLNKMDPETLAQVMPHMYTFLCGFAAGRESVREEAKAQPA